MAAIFPLSHTDTSLSATECRCVAGFGASELHVIYNGMHLNVSTSTKMQIALLMHALRFGVIYKGRSGSFHSAAHLIFSARTFRK